MNPIEVQPRPGDQSRNGGEVAAVTDLERDLVGANLAGRNLAGQDLSGRDLSGADLSGADLTDCRFNGAILRDAVLARAQLDQAQFLGADLTGADLSEVVGDNAVFGRANLNEASLFSASLDDATFAHADLTNADLRAAQLERARLREAKLIGTDLTRARIPEADLTRANLDRAVLRDVDMRRSRMKSVTGYSTTDWIGVDVLDVDYAGAYMVRRTIMDQNYLYEFRHKNRLNGMIYQIWWITSDCGRSFVRWATWTFALAILFALVYTRLDMDYGPYESVLSPLYYSVVTMTTLGFGDALPASPVAQVFSMAEVVIGHVMLGGMLSIFATKMGRRAA